MINRGGRGRVQHNVHLITSQFVTELRVQVAYDEVSDNAQEMTEGPISRESHIQARKSTVFDSQFAAGRPSFVELYTKQDRVSGIGSR